MVVLFGFYVWSGVDVIGNFVFKGQLECWKVFFEVDEECVVVFVNFGFIIFFIVGMFYIIEKLVC